MSKENNRISIKLAFLGLLVFSFSIILLISSCKKDPKPGPITPPVDTTVVIEPPVEPVIANTIGFFMNDWEAKAFTAPSYTDKVLPAITSYTINVNPSAIITKVPKSEFGNNANLWMTQMVTESSLMQNITNLHPYIIRFPGGSISDVFFWNSNKNSPPADAPDSLVDYTGKKSPSGFWFGKNTESWTLAVDNYYNMLQQTNNQGIITINYGYARYGRGANPVAAAAHLAADWVRYDNGRTKYWEIGNENFGNWEAGFRIDKSKNKDGQPEILTSTLYGKHFNVFADSMRKAAASIGKTIYIGAVFAESATTSNGAVPNWNSEIIGQAKNKPDFYVVHSYFTPYNSNSNATVILNSATTESPKIMSFVQQELQANGAEIRPVVMDEWNIFAVGSMQPVSFINGMHAVLVMGEALRNKYGMTARWDFANGWDSGNDHGMFSSGSEPGVPAWNPRPAFYYMYFFQKMLGDRLVESDNGGNTSLVTYASSFSSGQVGVTIVNKGTSQYYVKLNIKNFRKGSRFYWYVLTGGSDNGEFSRKVFVNDNGTNYEGGGPANYAGLTAFSALTTDGIKVTVPARSVICLVVDKK
jgi:hypothetical protein